MKTMTYNQLVRLTFCNSKKLTGKQFILNGKCYEWVGIGLVETKSQPEKYEQITIIDFK